MCAPCLHAKAQPDLVVYKRAGGQELSLHVFQPQDRAGDEPRPAVLVLHGGGWGGGQPSSVYRFANHFAELGYVGISVQYRLYKNGEVTVADCVKDVRSAIRYVRAHAAELRVTPENWILFGYSAGGHLAAGAVLFDDCDEPEEAGQGPLRPAALVMYSPALDTSIEGYGNARLGKEWQRLSPLLRVRAGMPPVFICHSRDDKTVPYAGTAKFAEAAAAMGNECELLTLEGAEHNSVMRDPTYASKALSATDAFLRERGLLPARKK